MSTDPTVLNPVVVNDDLTKAVQGALDPADIRAAILAEAAKQTTAATTAAAAQTAAETQAAEAAAAADRAAAAATVFTCTEIIGGREFMFSEASQAELDRAVANAYRVAYAVQTPTEERVETPDPVAVAEAERRAAEERASNLADLELKFKRGEISTADYIEQSGAMDEFLAKKGVPLSALKEAVDQTQNSQFEKSWAQATEEFLRSPAGADWPGGNQNLQIIGMQIQSMNLLDAPDKVAALVRAYNAMKESHMVFPAEQTAPVVTPPAAAAVVAPAAVDAPAAVAAPAAAAAPRVASSSSSLFGASSGVGAQTTTTTAAAGKVDVPADMTPLQIIEEWKKAQVAGGKDPNQAFTETFSARRA